MKPFRAPLLAASLMPSNVEHTNENILREMRKLRYPVLATKKIDGVRGLRFNGTLLSRSLKEIPNKVIRERALIMPSGFDVEICRDDLPYDQNESIIMSREHDLSNTMEFHVIDWYKEGNYAERSRDIMNVVMDMPDYVRWLPPVWCNSAEELLRLFLDTEAEDGEGICFRLPSSLYVQKRGKENRSTLKEQTLVKLARYIREEATIIGFEEQYENGNADKRNALGKMDRSSAAANLTGKNMLGALVCVLPNNSEIRIGTGFSNALRKEIWNNKAQWASRQIVFKHKPFGKKNKPRSPIYVGLRQKGY